MAPMASMMGSVSARGGGFNVPTAPPLNVTFAACSSGGYWYTTDNATWVEDLGVNGRMLARGASIFGMSIGNDGSLFNISTTGVTWTAGESMPVSRYARTLTWLNVPAVFACTYQDTTLGAVGVMSSANLQTLTYASTGYTANQDPGYFYSPVRHVAGSEYCIIPQHNTTRPILSAPTLATTPWTQTTLAAAGITGTPAGTAVSTTAIYVLDEDGKVWRSTTGTSYTQVSTVALVAGEVSFNFANGLFFIFQNETNAPYLTSPDGVAWTSRTSPVTRIAPLGVYWNPDSAMFMLIGSSSSNSRLSYISPTGIGSWTALPEGAQFSTNPLAAAAYSTTGAPSVLNSSGDSVSALPAPRFFELESTVRRLDRRLVRIEEILEELRSRG